MEDDSERGRVELEEEQQLSACTKLLEKDDMRMEKDGLLPGFHQGGGGYFCPSTPPPLRSAVTSLYLREKRASIFSVTFSCPVTPYVTSL